MHHAHHPQFISAPASALPGRRPATSPPARADVLALDWSHLSAAYQSGAANSGTTQNFTVGSNTVSTVFGVVGNTTAANAFILSTPTVATYGSTAPNSTSYANGGVSDGTLALQIGIALPDTTTEGVQFTINFSQAVYGATFKLFDVDYSAGNFTDQIRNILGVNGATTVLPTLTGSASNSVGTDAEQRGGWLQQFRDRHRGQHAERCQRQRDRDVCERRADHQHQLCLRR